MKGRENKPHIGLFGRRNFGKSSLINALTNQDFAIVSPIAGTTTDPIKKSIELFGIGPAILIDTAGIDDVGELGAKRMSKTLNVLPTVDLALIVTNNYLWENPEKELAQRCRTLDIPFLIVNNKTDETEAQRIDIEGHSIINVSARGKLGMQELTEKMAQALPPNAYIAHSLLGDVINENSHVWLVTPIDSEAPEGRLILPQVQLIRDILDNNAVVTVMKEEKLPKILSTLPHPDLVVTDSQVFSTVSKVVPDAVPLTSFSIILAHFKGDFERYLAGTPHIDKLQEGDRILILESCTHQTSCEDIGRVKLPRWIQAYTKKKLDFTFVNGLEQVPDIQHFAMVVQCGGCMITRKQLLNHLQPAVRAGVPITNYGMLIAYINGIFHRAVRPFR